jgi:DNA replication protein DnaC
MSIQKAILKEYERSKTNAEIKLKELTKQIYTQFPEIKKLDEEIAKIGIELARATLTKSGNIEELINEINEKNMDLQIRKAEILHENGYPKDFLTIKYDCSKCNDTGFIGKERCSCYKQKLINYAYKEANLSTVTKDESFDTFDFSFYSDEVNPNLNLSGNDMAKLAYNAALDFTNNFDLKFNNLLFTGSTGVGKTFLCNAIAKELLDKGKTVLYLTAFELFKKIEDYRFNKGDNDFPEDPLNHILSVDLLIIDDLGSEFLTSLTTAELFNCINSRLLNKKHTVISTNLPLSELKNHYSDRTLSRIIGNYSILEIYNQDIRFKKISKA